MAIELGKRYPWEIPIGSIVAHKTGGPIMVVVERDLDFNGSKAQIGLHAYVYTCRRMENGKLIKEKLYHGELCVKDSEGWVIPAIEE